MARKSWFRRVFLGALVALWLLAVIWSTTHSQPTAADLADQLSDARGELAKTQQQLSDANRKLDSVIREQKKDGDQCVVDDSNSSIIFDTGASGRLIPQQAAPMNQSPGGSNNNGGNGGNNNGGGDPEEPDDPPVIQIDPDLDDVLHVVP